MTFPLAGSHMSPLLYLYYLYGDRSNPCSSNWQIRARYAVADGWSVVFCRVS